MARLVQLRRTCNHGMDCPTLHYRPDSDEFLIQGYIVTDPQVLAGLNLPTGQTVVRVPTYLLPELQPDPDADDLLVQGHEVPIDGSDLSVYLAGGEQPHNPDKQAWEEHLRAERAAGIWRHRVHLIDTTYGLGSYLRYECEWGYTATTAAGEGVRILDLPTDRRPPELTEIDHDFWLIDGERVLRMHYYADATFHGAELLPAQHTPRYQAARDVAWDTAEEFTSWWAAHPQYHRANQPVA